jgi:lipoprotein-releasing system permease protein
VNSRFANTSLFLGWRFFAGRQRQALISFISAVSVVGLALAIALLILVLSVMNGFEKEFRERILGLAPHATLWFDQPVKNWHSIVELLEEQPDIIRVQPLIEFKAMAVVANQVRPMLVQGVDYQRFNTLISPYLSQSNEKSDLEQIPSTKALAKNEIILGAHLAKLMKLKPGDNVRLMVPSIGEGDFSSLSAGSSSRAKTYAFTVSDILSTGTEIDNGIGLVNLSDASAITGLDQQIQGIQIQVNDLFQAHYIAMRMAINHQLPVRISDWTQSFGNLYTAIQLSRQMVALLLTTIIAVAVFNVFVTLGMVVRHKQTEIAILRTMGLSRRGVLLSFVVQGMMISVLGCIFGVVLGCVLALAAPSLVSGLELLIGTEFLQTDVYPINYLPSEIKSADIFTVCGAALLMSLIATLYPAWRAAGVLPASALRYL